MPWSGAQQTSPNDDGQREVPSTVDIRGWNWARSAPTSFFVPEIDTPLDVHEFHVWFRVGLDTPLIADVNQILLHHKCLTFVIIDVLDEPMLNVNQVVKGDMLAKTTYQRSAKGPLSISESSADGKYVCFENTGRRVSLMIRRIDGDCDTDIDCDTCVVWLDGDCDAGFMWLDGDCDTCVMWLDGDCDTCVMWLDGDCDTRVMWLDGDCDTCVMWLDGDCDTRVMWLDGDCDTWVMYLHSKLEFVNRW